jgi:hypothetical protein
MLYKRADKTPEQAQGGLLDKQLNREKVRDLSFLHQLFVAELDSVEGRHKSARGK